MTHVIALGLLYWLVLDPMSLKIILRSEELIESCFQLPIKTRKCFVFAKPNEGLQSASTNRSNGDLHAPGLGKSPQKL